MSLLPVLAVDRWLHLMALAILFGAALFPLYAPTGRFLDRPLRSVVRTAGFCALATALAETGVATASLPRLGLIAFACLICVSLRRNSWTALTQARVLALIAGMALASEPFSASAHGDARFALRVLEAAGLVIAGAWLGALVPLQMVVAKSVSDAAARGSAGIARKRAFQLAGFASALLVMIGVAERYVGDSPPPVPFIQLGLVAALFGLAAVDRYVLLPRTDGATATTIIRLQGVFAVVLIGSAALLWAMSTAG